MTSALDLSHLVAAAAFGACLGSFFNVVVWRLPRGESVVHPGSHCPACGHAIPWYRNLPVVTWLLQRGRCAWCGVRIPAFYVIVEALCGLLGLAGGCLWIHGWNPGDAGGWTVFALFAVPIGLIDWERFEIPDSLVVATAVAGLAVRALGSEDPAWAVGSSIRDGLLAAGFLYALHFGSRVMLGGLGALVRSILPSGIRWGWRRGSKREVLDTLLRWARFDNDMEALGLGDVSLGLAAGACLGFPSILLGLAPAALFGMLGHLWRRSRPAHAEVAAKLGLDPLAIPFGPFLAMGFLVARVWIGLVGSPFPF